LISLGDLAVIVHGRDTRVARRTIIHQSREHCPKIVGVLMFIGVSQSLATKSLVEPFSFVLV
jgi:hypothetical protein